MDGGNFAAHANPRAGFRRAQGLAREFLPCGRAKRTAFLFFLAADGHSETGFSRAASLCEAAVPVACGFSAGQRGWSVAWRRRFGLLADPSHREVGLALGLLFSLFFLEHETLVSPLVEDRSFASRYPFRGSFPLAGCSAGRICFQCACRQESRAAQLVGGADA